MKLRRQAPAPIEWAFCERSTATDMSQEHIRRVGPEGLKNGGGTCGLAGTSPRTTVPTAGVLVNEVTEERVRRLAEPRDSDGRVFLHPACAEAWLGLTWDEYGHWVKTGEIPIGYRPPKAHDSSAS